jgi:hypothetical protein
MPVFITFIGSTFPSAVAKSATPYMLDRRERGSILAMPNQGGTDPARLARLRAAAERALAEAKARRNAAAAPPEAPVEINGRDGPEPVRFGDWEVKGVASDF